MPPEAETQNAGGSGDEGVDAGHGGAGATGLGQDAAPCGNEGESCCANARACAAGLTCRSTSCTRCASLRSLGPFSYANGVSADGSTVVGGAGNLPYRWATLNPDEQRRSLGLLPGSLDSTTGGVSMATSADGTVVVGRSFSTLTGTTGLARAFRWTESTQMTDMGDLSGVAPLAFESSAWGTNADGRVVVGVMQDGLRDRAFRWDLQQNGSDDLGDLPGLPDASNVAYGTSADGSVVVGASVNESGTRAFRWTLATGVMEDLGTVPDADAFSPTTTARAVSGDGLVVVGEGYSADYVQVGFRWTRATGLAPLGAVTSSTSSRATATNTDGSVVVGSMDVGNSTDAVIWVVGPEAAVDLLIDRLPPALLDEWELTSATGVSDDGTTIVGDGRYQGEPEAWVAVLGADCEE
jgi:probable HAF family extracellular repeat protein